MDAKINASIPEVRTRSLRPMEDISECMIMQNTIHIAAMNIIANVSFCINEKIDEAETYIVDIYVKSKLALDKIKEIRDESVECLKEVDGITELNNAIACIAKATAKGTLVVGHTVPAVTLDIGKLLFEISTLEATLPLCISPNALLALSEEADIVVASVKDCIKEKLEVEPTDKSEEKDEEYTGEQINEEQSNNEVVDKYPEEHRPSNSDDESTNEDNDLIEIHE